MVEVIGAMPRDCALGVFVRNVNAPVASCVCREGDEECCSAFTSAEEGFISNRSCESVASLRFTVF